MRRIYLDNAATTPMLPEVREAMAPWLNSEFGNPSSLHLEGRHAKQAIDEAREALSERLGCLFAEVLFTSGGTEAANLAILGAALGNTDSARTRLLLGAAEHHCVLHLRPLLERLGYTVQVVPVDRFARVRIDRLQEMLSDDVLLVSVMHANNEFGTVQPVQEVVALAKNHGALYHCDAVQTFGTSRALSVPSLQPDLVTVSAHKIHGPKGVGAVYVRAGTMLKPIALGGSQEREVRAGTENVAGIVGFGEAVRRLSEIPKMRSMRDFFLERLVAAGFLATTPPEQVDILDSHAHVRLPGIDAETFLIKLDREGIAASSGAACSSGSLEPSHVMLAAGFSEREAREGLRFTFGRMNTEKDAAEAADRVIAAAAALRRP